MKRFSPFLAATHTCVRPSSNKSSACCFVILTQPSGSGGCDRSHASSNVGASWGKRWPFLFWHTTVHVILNRLVWLVAYTILFTFARVTGPFCRHGWRGTMTLDETVRRVAAYDKFHRVSDGPRRVVPEPLVKWVWVPPGKKQKDRYAWSRPRGYELSIREEAALYKPWPKRSQIAPSPVPRAIKSENKPTQSTAPPQPKKPTLSFSDRLHRILGIAFCMRVEVESYIRHKKVDMTGPR